MADNAVVAAVPKPMHDKDTYGSTAKREDFSSAIQEAQALATALAQSGDLTAAVDVLLAVEKRTRTVR